MPLGLVGGRGEGGRADSDSMTDKKRSPAQW